MPLVAKAGHKKNSEVGEFFMMSFNTELFPFWNLHNLKQIHHELLCPLTHFSLDHLNIQMISSPCFKHE